MKIASEQQGAEWSWVWGRRQVSKEQEVVETRMSKGQNIKCVVWDVFTTSKLGKPMNRYVIYWIPEAKLENEEKKISSMAKGNVRAVIVHGGTHTVLSERSVLMVDK